MSHPTEAEAQKHIQTRRQMHEMHFSQTDLYGQIFHYSGKHLNHN